MELKEVVLLYNIDDEQRMNLYKDFFEAWQIELKPVTREEGAVPLGFLAYGTKEQKADYMTGKQDSTDFPKEAMMIFAGITNQRLTPILTSLRQKGLTEASLKAVLTEYNAVWDSMTLYEELAKEREQFEKR